SIDATVSAGYTWENWTKSAGNDPASATTKNTTVTITKTTTLTANASVNSYTVEYYQGKNSTTA
ncbi:hypothetical protein IKO18_03850, partial [bacterium]|nr:hypothetical protein [bacterium]